MKRFLSFVLALILVMSMVAGMVSCDTTDDPSDTTQTGITELEEAKTNAKSALDSYVNAEDYRDSEKALLETTIANGKTAIDSATTTADVTAALNSAKALIDAIKTDAVLTSEELVAAKNTAKTVLDGYVSAESYREAQKAELATAIADGKTAIDESADITAVSTALNNAKAAIDAIKTDADFTAEELLAAKNTAKAELDIYVNSSNYRTEEQALLASAIAEGKNAIDSATDISAVNTALATAKAAIDGIKTDAELTAEELATAKTNAKAELDSYANANDYRVDQQALLVSAIANGKVAIDGAADISAVSTALVNAKAAIDEIKTDAELTAEELAAAKAEAKSALDAYVDLNDYRAEQQSAITTAIANGKIAIDAAITKAGVTSALDSAKLAIDAIKTDSEMTADELANAKQTAKNALSAYVNAENYREAQKTELSSAITNGNNAIDAAADITAVNSALANAKAVIDTIKTNAQLTAEELIAAKTAAKTTLESYKNSADYRDAQKAELQSAIANGKAAIDAATNISGVESALATAKATIDAIETDAEITAKEPTITTSFANGQVFTNTKATIDVWAKTATGIKLNKANVSVTVNDVEMSVNWDDDEKTSYNFVFVEGKNTVVITAVDGAYTKTVSYTVTCNLSAPTTITVAVEGFSIGIGYIIEPYTLVLDEHTLAEMASMYEYASAEDMKENLTAAYVLDYVLQTNGLEMDYQGRLSSGGGFYMSAISGLDTSNIAVPEELYAKLEENRYSVDESAYEDGTLGEFDITRGAGWMYAVNGVFPNVGFCDYIPQNGDVMRIQFTLALGADLGSTMGGDLWFETVNKENLTALIAQALEVGVDVKNAQAVVSTFGVTQTELDSAYNALQPLVTEANFKKVKANAKTSLESYVNASDYRTAEQEELATAIANGKAAIENATDLAGVEAALANAKMVIDEIQTDEELTIEETFVFELTSDGYYILKDISKGVSKIVVPATYRGKPITEIAENAFSYDDDVVSIDLTNCISLRKIGNWNFYDMPNLVSVDLSNLTNLMSIGDCCFGNVEKLTTVNFEGLTALQTIGGSFFTWGGISTNAEIPVAELNFSDCVSLISIGDMAFWNMPNLKELDFTNTKLQSIGYKFIMHCDALETIKLPATLNGLNIGRQDSREHLVEFMTFTPALKEIVVAQDNPYLVVDNGALMNTAKTTIYKYAVASQATTYVAPTTVLRVEGHAFYEAKNLTLIDFTNAKVQVIGFQAFANCSNATLALGTNSNYSYGDGNALYDKGVNWNTGLKEITFLLSFNVQIEGIEDGQETAEEVLTISVLATYANENCDVTVTLNGNEVEKTGNGYVLNLIVGDNEIVVTAISGDETLARTITVTRMQGNPTVETTLENGVVSWYGSTVDFVITAKDAAGNSLDSSKVEIQYDWGYGSYKQDNGVVLTDNADGTISVKVSYDDYYDMFYISGDTEITLTVIVKDGGLSASVSYTVDWREDVPEISVSTTLTNGTTFTYDEPLNFVITAKGVSGNKLTSSAVTVVANWGYVDNTLGASDGLTFVDNGDGTISVSLDFTDKADMGYFGWDDANITLKIILKDGASEKTVTYTVNWKEE